MKENTLDNILPGRWVRFKFDPIIDMPPSNLKGVSGNYAIILNGKVNYVGKSNDLYMRLGVHNLAISFQPPSKMEIAIRKESNHEKVEIEKKLIIRLKPMANRIRYLDGKPKIELGGLVKELNDIMEEKGLSPEKMSKFIGCSGRHIYRWLSGRIKPTILYRDVISKGIKKARRL